MAQRTEGAVGVEIPEETPADLRRRIDDPS
ncbi:MAG: hypothetical protein QOC92_3391 [Acidimicrobiaceae bacterium]|jgi:hypothetical protein